MKLIAVAIGIFLSTQSSSSASTRLRQTNSGVESSDAAKKKSRNYLRSLQEFEMSMSMPSMTASIESTSESGSDDTWVAEVINKLESKTGITIAESVAMDIVKSNDNELPAHHYSGIMKCRWFLASLFKYKHYYFFGLSDDHLNHIIDNVCGDEDEDGPETSNPSAAPTSKSTAIPTISSPTTPSPTTASPTFVTTISANIIVVLQDKTKTRVLQEGVERKLLEVNEQCTAALKKTFEDLLLPTTDATDVTIASITQDDAATGETIVVLTTSVDVGELLIVY